MRENGTSSEVPDMVASNECPTAPSSQRNSPSDKCAYEIPLRVLDPSSQPYACF